MCQVEQTSTTLRKVLLSSREILLLLQSQVLSRGDPRRTSLCKPTDDENTTRLPCFTKDPTTSDCFDAPSPKFAFLSNLCIMGVYFEDFIWLLAGNIFRRLNLTANVVVYNVSVLVLDDSSTRRKSDLGSNPSPGNMLFC